MHLEARRARSDVTERSNVRLNQPKKPRCSCFAVVGLEDLRGTSAGVRVKATTTDSIIDDTIVIENCR